MTTPPRSAEVPQATRALATRGRRRPEVLAPAGDAASMRAAVRAGADAVYFGLQGFNARARAQNFDAAALGETMAGLHQHGVKGYVTLNTLVFDDELPALEAAIRACALAGVDAIIVQDLGVLGLARAIAPTLPVHASTQMTCTDAASVELARELGATRVILARELSLDDIVRIRAKTDVELEVFVHGALCVAYSGQCLTSEAIGGRSANRGACAQACRLPYELVVDGVLQELGDRAYLLSPQDLEASAAIPQLIALGISSVKIEGRLKGPEYVAATTKLYRRAIDAAMGEGEGPGERERRAALQAFSRGSGPGFFEGVDHQRLVEARGCDHRGVEVGRYEGLARARGKAHLRVVPLATISRGDGILVEGGFGGEGEVGGRVWTLAQGGREVEQAAPGSEALVWLGPERSLEDDVPAGRRVFLTSDPASEQRVRAEIEREPHRVRIDAALRGAVGEPPVLEATSERGARASVVLDAPLARAERAPLAADDIREKLGKLGDSPFWLGELVVDFPDGSILPLSSLNRARRALVEALIAASQRSHPLSPEAASGLPLSPGRAAAPPDRPPPPPGLFVLCRTLEQAEAAIEAGAAGVYLDFLELTGTGAALRALRSKAALPGGREAHITVTPPRIRKPGEEKIDRYLASLGPDAILVRSLGALRGDALFDEAPEEGSEGGEGSLGSDGGTADADRVPPAIAEDPARAGRAPPARIGDFSLNVTNRLTAAEVLSRGLSAFTPSFDLDAAQLLALMRSPFGPYAEVVVHHPMPLFHMEHCVFAALMSEGRDHRTCGRPCEAHKISLRDRAGMDHPVEADVGCRNTVFHAMAQSAATLVPQLQASGVRRFRVELVRESAADVRRILGAYLALIEGRTNPLDATRALKVEGGYGVVKGSLRVLGAGP
jgi:U32 family peptidase